MFSVLSNPKLTFSKIWTVSISFGLGHIIMIKICLNKTVTILLCDLLQNWHKLISAFY